MKIPLSQISEGIDDLIKSYAEELDNVWMHREDGEGLSISFTIKLSTKEGKNHCDVSISFIKERIKETVGFDWNPNQPDLPLKATGN